MPNWTQEIEARLASLKLEAEREELRWREYGVRPFDAVTFAVVLAVLVVTAAAAVAGPALRATRIDPVGALRSE